ncbi:MAG: DUF1934 domain-containing protein [Clostridia bacterium]|nr:DUF1934 domain-containing protein [Clostridia bacterium]
MGKLKLKITSTSDGDTVVSTVDNGEIKYRDDKILLSFTLITEDIPLKTDIMLTDGRAVISRSSPSKTSLILQKGKTTNSQYGLMFATVPVRVFAKQISYDIKDDKGFLELEYDIFDLSQQALSLKIRIDIL